MNVVTAYNGMMTAGFWNMNIVMTKEIVVILVYLIVSVLFLQWKWNRHLYQF